MSNAPAVLRADWESPWRPLRNLLAVALTIVAALVPALFWLQIFVDQTTGPNVQFGAAFAKNTPAIALALLWTLIVLAQFGPKLGEQWRHYRESS